MAERPADGAVRAACLASLLAVSVSGRAVPAALLVLAVLALLQGAVWVVRPGGRTATALGALGFCLGLAGMAASTGGVAQALGPLLAGVQTALLARARTARDQRTALITAFGLATVAASVSSDPLRGAPVLACAVAGLVALASLNGLRGRQVVAPVALTAVLGVVAFLLVPAPPVQGRGGLPGAAPEIGSGRAGLFSADRLDMSVRGELPATPVLQVDATSPALWRSQVYYGYDGRRWYGSLYGGREVRGTDVRLAASDAPLPAYQASPLEGWSGEVYAPGRVTRLQTAEPVSVLSSREGALRFFPPGSYTVTVAPQVPVDRPQPGPGGVDAAPGPQALALPSTLPDRVVALAQSVTAGAPDAAAKARAISAWLEDNVRYTLDSPVPARGEDAVDRVLFVDRTGFCEQFAAAEVVLLRAVGVPARMVTGLAYGTPEGGARVYRGKDLHAWVELWVPGTGWVTDDPTAGAQVLESSGSVLAQASAAVRRWLGSVVDAVGGRPAAAAGLLVVAALLLWTTRRAPRARRDTVPGSTAVAAYRRWNRRLGAAGRREPESLRELGERVGEPVASALHVVEQELYAPTAPDPQAAVEVLDRA